jgi:hypothetical protein
MEMAMRNENGMLEVGLLKEKNPNKKKAFPKVSSYFLLERGFFADNSLSFSLS